MFELTLSVTTGQRGSNARVSDIGKVSCQGMRGNARTLQQGIVSHTSNICVGSRGLSLLQYSNTCGEVNTLASLLQETLQAAKKNDYKLAKPDDDALIAASSGASPPVQLAPVLVPFWLVLQGAPTPVNQ